MTIAFLILTVGSLILGVTATCDRIRLRRWMRRSAHLAPRLDLINELLNRKDFAGVVLFQVPPFDGNDCTDWNWRSQNCDAVNVIGQMLGQVCPPPPAPPAPAEVPGCATPVLRLAGKGTPNGRKPKRRAKR